MLEINKTHIGHVLDLFKPIEDGKIDCVITSPPYWGLRDYGLPPQIWDSCGACEHEWGNKISGAGKNNDQTAGEKQQTVRGSINRDNRPSSNFCIHCDAWRGSLGLEPTFQLYIQHLKQIFAEVKRVMKPTGSCWVNLGDSYCHNRLSSPMKGDYSGTDGLYQRQTDAIGGLVPKRTDSGVPTKSLCLIPERFILMMVDELGFIARNKIVWYKRNCMPSSAKDRFTVDWEPVFFFTKSQKYWFEQQFEPHSREWGEETWAIEGYKKDNPKILQEATRGIVDGCNQNPQGRNKRCVWDIPTQPFSEAHFAIFPEKLVETPILAGCPKEICNKCGKAREKIYETTYINTGSNRGVKNKMRAKGDLTVGHPSYDERKLAQHHFKGSTDCSCNAGFHPGVCLDPFIGSGTAGKVALAYGRNYIGFDLGYDGMSKKRTSEVQLWAYT